MARFIGAVILAGLGCVGIATAQEEAPQPTKRPEGTPSSLRRPGAGPMSPEFGNARRALEALTPEQRQRFIENLKRWTNLPPEQKKLLGDREGARRKKMAEETEVAINKIGLTIDGENRALFARRYAEERRKVEELLRKEMDEKRQPLLNDLIARLKEEFSSAGKSAK